VADDTETVVTEIIVDTRASEQGIAVLAAAMRASQAAFDSVIARAERTSAAQAALAASGRDAANTLGESSKALTAAARSADVYLGRLDPVIFATNALGKEASAVQTAIKGLDTLLLAGKGADDQSRRVTLLQDRLVELNTAMAQVKTGAISSADGLSVLNTEFERSGKASASASLGMRDYVLRAQDVTNANRMMANSQAAYNQIASEGLLNVARSSPAQPITNPLFGAVRDDREAGLVEALTTEYNALRAALVPLEAERQKFAEQEQFIADAMAKGAISANEASAATERLLAATSDGVKGLRDFEAAAADVDAANRKMALSQQAYNQIAGEGLLNQARSSPAQPISNPLFGDAFDARQTELVEAFGKGFDDLRAKIAPVDAALQKLRQTQADINEAFRLGAITETEAVQAKVRAGQAFDATTVAAKKTSDTLKEGTATSGQMKFAVQQLGVQTTQLFSQIASGQPVLTALIQQGHQVGDVMLSTGTGFSVFATAARSLVGFLASPIGIAVGIVAALGALAFAAESATERMGALRNQLSLVRDDFASAADAADAAARHLAATSSVSTADARTGVNLQFANPEVFKGTAADAEANTQLFVRLSAALGETTTNFSRLEQAMKDPAALMQSLLDNNHLKGVTQAFIDQLKVMQLGPDAWKATALAMDQIAKSTANATDHTSPLTEAIAKLMQALNGDGKNKGFLEVVGTPIVNALTTFFDDLTKGYIDSKRQIEEMIDLWGRLKKAIEDATPKGVTDLTQVAPPTQAPIALAGPLADAIRQGMQAALSDSDRAALLVNRTPNSQGQVSNATGVFQIIPGTAQMLGIDAGNALANIYGGLKYIQQLNTQFEGNTLKLLATYSGNAPGSAGLQKYIDAVTSADTGELSKKFIQVGDQKMTTAQAIQFWGSSLNMPPELIALGMSIATHESGGKQFNTPTGLPPSVGNLPAVVGGSTVAGGPGFTPPSVPQGTGGFGPDDKFALDPTSGTRGFGADAKQAIDAAQKLADAAGVSGAAFATAQEKIKAYVAGLKALADQGITSGDQVNRFREGLDKANAELTAAVAPVQGIINALNIQTSATQRETAATADSFKASQDMKFQIQAEADARKIGGEAMVHNATIIQALADKYRDAAVAQEEFNSVQKDRDSQQQIDFINAETASLTQSSDVRARNLAVMKEQQAIEKTGLTLAPEIVAERLKYAAALADANTQLQINSQALQEIGNLATQAFDQVGQAITQAFVGGQGAAVNFGNVARAVLTSVLQEVAKLAIINPLLNATIGGQNRTTLTQVLGALGAASGGTTVGAGAADSSSGVGTLQTGFSTLSSGNSILQALGFKGIGEQLGLTGPNGLFSGVGSGVSSFLNTPVSSALSGSFGTGGGAFLGGGQFGPVTSGLAQGGAGLPAAGATLGGVLGGVGAGFTLGSLVGTGVQSLTNKTGPGPEIGAGAGAALAVGAAALAPETFGISLLLAGLIGGTAGGALGGLIGPHPASAYSGTEIGLNAGQLTIGKSFNQIDASSADTAKAGVAAINQFTSAVGLTVTSLGNLKQIGEPDDRDPTKYADFASVFPQLRFGSSDPLLQSKIGNRSFASSDELNAAVADVQKFKDAIAGLKSALSGTDAAGRVDEWTQRFIDLSSTDFTASLANIATFVTQTVPALTAAQNNIGSLAAATAQVNDQYSAAITMAHNLGYKENELTVARDKAVQSLSDAAWAQVTASDQALNVRISNAQATLSGSRGDALNATLYSFDLQAAQARTDFANQLKGVFGDTYATTQSFADQMALLEKTLGLERLEITKQYNDQIAAAWAQVVQVNSSLQVRIANAQATLSGDPAAARAAALFQFDVQAQQARQQLSDQLKSSFGDAFATTASYAAEMALLEQTLGLERLVTAKQFDDQLAAQDAAEAQKRLDAAGTAAQAITSLTAYATSLKTSDASPLSPQDQLDLARSQFNAASGAAAAGDFNSLSQLQGFAQTFLAASRQVYGSGTAYVTDFQRVLDALQQVSNVPADTLTASVLQSETRTQTATLVEALADLKAAVDSVTTQLRQNQSAPARIAA
jgi:trimeric autotransporter adhesin